MLPHILHIRKSLHPYRFGIFLALFLILLHTLTGSFLVFFSRSIQKNDFPIYIVFVFSFHQLFSIFDDWILTGISHAWTRDTRRNILQSYLQRDMNITESSQYDWNEIQNEIYWLGESIFSFLRGFFRRILQIGVFSAFLLYLSPHLFLYCLVFFLFLLGFGVLYGRIINSLRARYIDSSSRLSVFELEAARSRSLIRIFRKISFFSSIHARFLEKNQKDAVKFDRLRMMQHPIQILMFLATVAIVFSTGSRWVFEGKLSLQNFYSFLAALSLLHTPLSGISSDITAFFSFKKLKYLNYILQENAQNPPDFPASPQPQLQRIQVDHLFFSYPDKPLFKSLHFEIAHSPVGIRGKNGSGKTTLALLLAGVLRPSRGSIAFYGPEGTLQNIPISYVDQNGTVFSLSLPENLLLDHTPSFHFLHLLPEILQKEIGPENISSGQRKSVSIERAFQHPCSLLILDEPENALDSEKKHKLREMLLEKNKQGVMIVLFSHDEFFLEICQEVLDMQVLVAQ